MEIPVYNFFEDFKDKVDIDYSKFHNKFTYSEYLHELRLKYDKIIYDLLIEIMQNLKSINDEVPTAEVQSNMNDFYEKYKNLPESLNNISAVEKYTDLLNEYFRTPLHDQKDEIKKILKFIDEKLLVEKNNLVRFQKPVSQTIEVSEPLTAKQQQKVGLLIRSGIIDFLRDKNPGISNNKISGFIELLTTEPMKKSSITSHLVDSTDNVKHPFYSNQSLDEIDLKLKQFGISPQSEK
ncbi:hypothetical protein [Kaistella carnis]|uniref:Uncharacterized protein n=1 Tax=Kaistella carnis TaxID=1241979 RepID=A0A3G8XLI6_9FLAO|nr:hypothetical protein [Kaistella carnis]AZI34072.1 hypothetical protein EIB73_13205 [Kaistella carnis]